MSLTSIISDHADLLLVLVAWLLLFGFAWLLGRAGAKRNRGQPPGYFSTSSFRFALIAVLLGILCYAVIEWLVETTLGEELSRAPITHQAVAILGLAFTVASGVAGYRSGWKHFLNIAEEEAELDYDEMCWPPRAKH